MDITPNALEELKKALINEGNPTAGIRIYAEQGCCSTSLQMIVGGKETAGDKTVSVDSVNFFIADSAKDLLEDVTIDYFSGSFKLLDSSQEDSCSCGSALVNTNGSCCTQPNDYNTCC